MTWTTVEDTEHCFHIEQTLEDKPVKIFVEEHQLDEHEGDIYLVILRIEGSIQESVIVGASENPYEAKQQMEDFIDQHNWKTIQKAYGEGDTQ